MFGEPILVPSQLHLSWSDRGSVRIELNRAGSIQIVILDVLLVLWLRSAYRLLHNHGAAKGMTDKGTITSHDVAPSADIPRTCDICCVIYYKGGMPTMANEIVT